MNTMTAKASYVTPQSIEIAFAAESLMVAASEVGGNSTTVTTSTTYDDEFRSRRRGWNSESWTSQGEE